VQREGFVCLQSFSLQQTHCCLCTISGKVSAPREVPYAAPCLSGQVLLITRVSPFSRQSRGIRASALWVFREVPKAERAAGEGHDCSPPRPEGPAQSVHTSNNMLQTVTSRQLARHRVRAARQVSRHSGRARRPQPFGSKRCSEHTGRRAADCSRLTP